MKKIALLFGMLLFAFGMQARVVGTEFSPAGCVSCDSTTYQYQQVEVQPEFPGGMKALVAYLSENIIYPTASLESRSQGRSIVRFVVNVDGSIENVEVLRSSGDVLLDKEAVRVVEWMPKWSPGKMQGKPVRVFFTLPITFRLK